jgi:phage terminase large subunit-like protein
LMESAGVGCVRWAACHGAEVTMNDVIQFIDANIRLNEKGEPWSLTKHQRVVLAAMYLRYFLIRLWSEIKKSGKTFLAGCIAIKEAVTRADAEVVCVANDEEQAQSRVFATCVALCQKNPELRASVVRITANEIRFSNGSVIRAVASDYKGAAGGRQVLTVFDELWAYDSERMTRLFEELRPPPTEHESYLLIVSYAGFTGESTVLQKLYERGLKGKRVGRYEVYTDKGMVMFWSHTGRMPWHTKRYFENEAADLRPTTFARLHRNEWVSSESTFILPEQWAACVDPNRTPMLGGYLDTYWGVDLGIKSDWGAVVGVTYDRYLNKVVIVQHKAWRPTKLEPVRLSDVEEFLLALKQKFKIMRIYVDPWQAASMIQRLKGVYGPRLEEFPQTTERLTTMGETIIRFGQVTKPDQLSRHRLAGSYL